MLYGKDAHIYIQLILIMHRFHMCEFAYLRKFIYNPQINTNDASVVS